MFYALPPFRAVRLWLRYRATLRQLYQLSAAELQDLGLCRAELPHIAHSACRRAENARSMSRKARAAGQNAAEHTAAPAAQALGQ